MELQEVEVTIQPDGTVQLAVRGVKGTQCVDLTGALEKQLGGEVIRHEKTPEYGEDPGLGEARISNFS
jgi:hypothetical protein